MIPIRLKWHRRTDGFELKVLVRSNGSKSIIAEPRGARTDPLLHQATNLEELVVLHLINCQTDLDYIKFLNRFGTLEPREFSKKSDDDIVIKVQYPQLDLDKPGPVLDKPAPADGSELQVVRKSEPGSVSLNALKSFALFMKVHITMTTMVTPIGSKERVRYQNDLLERANVVVHPFFMHSAEATRLVLEADTLFDFIVLEVAAIHDAGAVATSCEHCRKIFLTGPLTGRRSRAKYCSDRCRVAAMRVRNAAKED